MVRVALVVGRRSFHGEADRLRGIAAAWHYGRALELELRRRELASAGTAETAIVWLGRARDEHARIARGFLGAVGFERDSLVRRRGSAPA